MASTIVFGPFATGAGAQLFEAQWSQMMRTVFKDGVVRNYLNDLLVYADSTGMQVKVKTGAGWIKGHYYSNSAEETIALTAANATLARIDIIALEVDWTKSDNQMTVVLVTGTAAATPVIPALTQSTSKWQIPLAKVYVGAAVSTIASGNVTDIRLFQGLLGWEDPNETFAYASATTVTVASGALSRFRKGWKIKYTQLLTQPYTNDPASGSSITLNMTNTTYAHVGNVVYVSSGAGGEQARITAVVANTSITVDSLSLNHTTVNPLVTFAADALGTKYAYIMDIADTVVTWYSGCDHQVENTPISGVYYGFGDQLPGFPGYFRTVAPVFNTTTIDSGTGGVQPTVTQTNFSITGNKIHLRCILGNPAVKNGAGKYIVFTMPVGLPSILDPSSSVIGTSFFVQQDVTGVCMVLSSTDVYLYGVSSLADNADIRTTSADLMYRFF